MKAQIVYYPINGKHSLHNISNDNGQRLISLAALWEMIIGSTLFCHKDIYKGTRKNSDGQMMSDRSSLDRYEA
jgi:hypothetical protein